MPIYRSSTYGVESDISTRSCHPSLDRYRDVEGRGTYSFTRVVESEEKELGGFIGQS